MVGVLRNGSEPQMEHLMEDLENEAKKLTDLLQGRSVKMVWRHRAREVVIEFDDGTRLFVDAASDPLEFSVTGGCE
jgi:hypothetical protein